MSNRARRFDAAYDAEIDDYSSYKPRPKAKPKSGPQLRVIQGGGQPAPNAGKDAPARGKPKLSLLKASAPFVHLSDLVEPALPWISMLGRELRTHAPELKRLKPVAKKVRKAAARVKRKVKTKVRKAAVAAIKVKRKVVRKAGKKAVKRR